jgi:hypothetical protein
MALPVTVRTPPSSRAAARIAKQPYADSSSDQWLDDASNRAAHQAEPYRQAAVAKKV